MAHPGKILLWAAGLTLFLCIIETTVAASNRDILRMLERKLEKAAEGSNEEYEANTDRRDTMDTESDESDELWELQRELEEDTESNDESDKNTDINNESDEDAESRDESDELGERSSEQDELGERSSEQDELGERSSEQDELWELQRELEESKTSNDEVETDEEEYVEGKLRIKEDRFVDKKKEVETVLVKDKNGMIKEMASLNYKDRMLAVYNPKAEECYLVPNVDTKLQNISDVKLKGGYVTSDEIKEKVAYEKTKTVLKDHSNIPDDLIKFCQDKPLYLLKKPSGRAKRHYWHHHHRATVTIRVGCTLVTVYA